MSFRIAEHPRAAPGSLLGIAIDLPRRALSAPRKPGESLWEPPMAASPLAQPSGAGCSAEEVPPLELAPSSAASAAAAFDLESAVQTWTCDRDDVESAAYATFERSTTPTIVSKTERGTRRNLDPVHVRLVHCRSVAWAPIAAPEGVQAHAFLLLDDAGAVVSTIEAYMTSPRSAELQRVVVAHGTYSHLAHATEMCDRSAMLAFDAPDRYLDQLKSVTRSVEEDDRLAYLPLTELVLGRALERAIVRVDRSHPAADTALPAWSATKRFLGAMSGIVRDAVRLHNQREIARAGAREVEDAPL